MIPRLQYRAPVLRRVTWAPEPGPLVLRGWVVGSLSVEVVDLVWEIALLLRLGRQGLIPVPELREMLTRLD